MRIVCWQTILKKYYTLFLFENYEDVKNLSSATVVNDALRANLTGMNRYMMKT